MSTTCGRCMAPEHRSPENTGSNRERGRGSFGSHADTAGPGRRWHAKVLSKGKRSFQEETPDAVSRPGANHQFQFRECTIRSHRQLRPPASSRLTNLPLSKRTVASSEQPPQRARNFPGDASGPLFGIRRCAGEFVARGMVVRHLNVSFEQINSPDPTQGNGTKFHATSEGARFEPGPSHRGNFALSPYWGCFR
jgi:hypothetical protein